MRVEETRPGHDVTCVANATSEQLKAGTAFARACEVCVLPNLGPGDYGTVSPALVVIMQIFKNSLRFCS